MFAAETGGRFLGFPVQSVADHGNVPYDVLIIAVLERPAGTLKLLRQCGVPDSKLLMLHADGTALVGAAAQSPVQG